MGASDKLLVLLSPAEKSALAKRASAGNVSMGEWVRRAVSDYRPELASDKDEETALLRLTAELSAATRRAARAITRAENDIDQAIQMLRTTRAKLSKSPTDKL